MLLYNIIPEGCHRCTGTPDYDFTFVSGPFAQMLGYTRQELRDLFDDKFRKITHPEDWRRLFGSEVCMTAAKEGDRRYEYRIKIKKEKI